MTSAVVTQLEKHLNQILNREPGAVLDWLKFLARSFKAIPEHAVSERDFRMVAKTIGQTAKSLNFEELNACARELKIPKILRHWILALNDGKKSKIPLSEITAQVNVFRFAENRLALDFQLTPNQYKDLRISVKFGNKRFELSPTGEEAGHYLFNQEIAQSDYFRFGIEVPAKELTSISIEITDGPGENWIQAGLEFRAPSHLSPIRFQSWRVGGVSFSASKKRISIRPFNVFKDISRELLFLVTTFRGQLNRGPKSALKFVLVRLAYWFTYPILSRREIWITHDKMFSALDCGEYMYWHLHHHEAKKVEPYYAINSDAKDVSRLRGLGANLIHPGTVRHAVIYLHAKVIVTTHSNPASYNGFAGRNSSLYRDLMNARLLCIQHGLIMQGVYKTMHQGRSGIERLYCASKHEIENVSRPKFGYTPEQLAITGLARFDGLVGEPNSTLMISPTWRPELAGKSSGITRQRKANDRFLDSPFFLQYAEILEDKVLLQKAKQAGYKIQFVLHPIIAANVKIMRQGLEHRAAQLGISILHKEVVEVLGAGIDKSFDDLIKECAALVTDYSGIQYDVAYMMKEVVYFHPKALPAQYDHGVMNYETMGFGPVHYSSANVSKELVRIIDSQVELPEKYQKRITDFFENIDDQNCKRIFDDAAEFVGLGK